REAMGVVPELVESDADVELVIGDPALDRAEQGDEETIDLAAEWTRWSGLPFVFAAWYGDAAAEPELAAAYARGREKLAEYASGTRLTYLRERIRYEIGPREEEGLARFLELARHHSLL
ncbi:MAG: MqnA/MqnD/SBP family protein, partial [Planctomycetota bacterium]